MGIQLRRSYPAFFGLLLASACLLSLETNLFSNPLEEPKPGQVIERVACKNDPGQSYALYLPSNYSPGRKWALLAAFDPAARGVVPVERFKEAAERYGYIVCGSNNSRNGPLQPSATAAQSMLSDVSARFSVDEKQIYLTGFSGGARAATAIAVWLNEHVAGVIGAGAGFAQGIEPTSSRSFLFYGTVGDEDFNYAEIKQLERKLQSAGVIHRIDVFEGGHSWPPSDVAVRAIEWIELQAMKSGKRSRDESFIDRLFKRAVDSASALESASRPLEAYFGYLAIASDFKGLRDVSDSEKKISLLKASKPVRQAISQAEDRENEEIRRGSELHNLRARAMGSTITTNQSQTPGLTSDSEARQLAIADLKAKLNDLRRKSDSPNNSPDRSFARRVLNQYTAASVEQSAMLIQAKKYDLAISVLITDSLLMPDNWRVLYNLACAYSLKGDKRRAIESLAKAVQKGFTNVRELERNDQLNPIREEPEFKRILEELTQKRGS